MKYLFWIILFLIVAFTGGCAGSSPPYETISIIIPLQPEKFSTQAVVHVVLLNQAQIAIEDANPVCLVMGNGSGVTSTQCPPGTEYKKVTPEEFTFHIEEIRDQIQVTSSQLQLGEKFQITVAGLSADDCNKRSTEYSGVANAEIMVLKDLLWATTAMACVKTP